ELLQDGEVLSTDVERAMRAAGIADRTIARAKRRLGVQARRDGFGRGARWWLSLPFAKAATDVTKAATASEVAAFDQLRAVSAVLAPGSAKTATAQEMAAFVANGSLREAQEALEI